jgi:peptide/nickel transport system ATP-binding protein
MSSAGTADLYVLEGVSRTYRLPRTSFRGPRRSVSAVREVSLEIRRGETLGVVGESGSGKSTLLRLLLGLEAPSAGTVRYLGGDRRREVGIVFQDPVSALDPRMRVSEIILEPIRVQRLAGGPERVAELLEAVGLPRGSASRFPHEFSGGQRQRIAIARALVPRPLALLADEPVSALDVSVRAQILNLLQDLKEEFGLTLVVVSHDLSVVRHLCDRLVVMREGVIVERGSTEAVFTAPQSDYTKELLAAIPRVRQRRRG